MYSLVSLISGIYPLPAMHSLLVTLFQNEPVIRNPKSQPFWFDLKRVGFFRFRITFENQTNKHLNYFQPLEYWTSLVFTVIWKNILMICSRVIWACKALPTKKMRKFDKLTWKSWDQILVALWPFLPDRSSPDCPSMGLKHCPAYRTCSGPRLISSSTFRESRSNCRRTSVFEKNVKRLVETLRTILAQECLLVSIHHSDIRQLWTIWIPDSSSIEISPV